jgi:hypothetical protein
MKIGNLVKVTALVTSRGWSPIGIIVSRHTVDNDPMYFVLLDGNEIPFRQGQLEVIA